MLHIYIYELHIYVVYICVYIYKENIKKKKDKDRKIKKEFLNRFPTVHLPHDLKGRSLLLYFSVKMAASYLQKMVLSSAVSINVAALLLSPPKPLTRLLAYSGSAGSLLSAVCITASYSFSLTLVAGQMLSRKGPNSLWRESRSPTHLELI